MASPSSALFLAVIQSSTGLIGSSNHDEAEQTIHFKKMRSFILEWWDDMAAATKRYLIQYYLQDGSLEMWDLKKRKQYLKRGIYDSIHLSDLYVGNELNVLGKLMAVVDYGDLRTKKEAENLKRLFVIEVDAELKYVGMLFECFAANDLQVITAQTLRLSALHPHVLSRFVIPDEQSGSYLTSTKDRILVFEVVGENVEALKDVIRVLEDKDATKKPVDEIPKHIYVIDEPVMVDQARNFFFPSHGRRRMNTATYAVNTTCCVIKPHAVRAGLTGKIIQAILKEGFKIEALRKVHLDIGMAKKFYEVYKGVVEEYLDMLKQIVSGACISMEISSSAKEDNVVRSFRELVGPSDPELARKIRPKTLRAQFGEDLVHNCMHCTHLPGDAVLEVKLFFGD